MEYPLCTKGMVQFQQPYDPMKDTTFQNSLVELIENLSMEN